MTLWWGAEHREPKPVPHPSSAPRMSPLGQLRRIARVAAMSASPPIPEVPLRAAAAQAVLLLPRSSTSARDRTAIARLDVGKICSTMAVQRLVACKEVCDGVCSAIRYRLSGRDAHGRLGNGCMRPAAAISQANRPPQSLSPYGGLADLAPKHEWRPLGRSHPRSCP